MTSKAINAETNLSPPLPTIGTYLIDSARSTVAYSGRHMFGLGTVRAVFTVTSGEIRVANPTSASSARVTIDAASFESGNAKRDRDVRSAGLLDTAAYADITFTSDTLRYDGVRWVLTGSVTAHGTAVPTDLSIDGMTQKAGVLHVEARAQHLDRYAFGVTGAKGMVGRYFDLHLDVYCVPA